MNEIDALSLLRAEVPDRGTARAEDIFRTALAKDLSSERTLVSLPRNRFRHLRPAWRAAIAAPLALGLAVGVTVAVLPSGGQAPAPLTATLLADRAAAAALANPTVPAGQWIYQQIEFSRPGALRRAGEPNPFVQAGWMTADGTMTYGGAGIVGNPIYPYSKLGSLPRDPAKLDAYFVSLDPDKTDNKSVVAFSQIKGMLFGMVLPPSLEAEMYHALALIPMVQVKDDVKDIAGRAGVAFLLPPTKQSEQQEIILDASDYRLLAEASWDNPGNPSTLSETAILKEYPVAELGSTQPSTTPPTAAELAAEKIFFYEEYEYAPTKINYVAPGQWLYRKISVGGTDQEIWATADDSAQAQYVNGTLEVCRRTDPSTPTAPAAPTWPATATRSTWPRTCSPATATTRTLTRAGSSRSPTCPASQSSTSPTPPGITTSRSRSRRRTARPPSWSTPACSAQARSSTRDMCGTVSRRSF